MCVCVWLYLERWSGFDYCGLVIADGPVISGEPCVRSSSCVISWSESVVVPAKKEHLEDLHCKKLDESASFNFG